jgi:hypothetical protein
VTATPRTHLHRGDAVAMIAAHRVAWPGDGEGSDSVSGLDPSSRSRKRGARTRATAAPAHERLSRTERLTEAIRAAFDLE